MLVYSVPIAMYQSIDRHTDIGEERAVQVELHEQDYLLRAYNIFSTITAVCLACIIFTSTFIMVVDTKINTMIDFSYFLLCLLSLFFVFIAFLCEMGWLESIRQSTIFQNWVFRGIFYSYLGIFTFVEYGRAIVFTVDFSLAVKLISFLLTVLGLIYCIMVSSFVYLRCNLLWFNKYVFVHRVQSVARKPEVSGL